MKKTRVYGIAKWKWKFKVDNSGRYKKSAEKLYIYLAYSTLNTDFTILINLVRSDNFYL